jgi:lipopolysaccharide biosynthesis regulator YciM
MPALYIDQVRALLIIGQIGTDALGHEQDESAIVHIEPVRATDEFVVPVTHKRAVQVYAQVGKTAPFLGPSKSLPKL